jgi:hypothetical protein
MVPTCHKSKKDYPLPYAFYHIYAAISWTTPIGRKRRGCDSRKRQKEGRKK